MASLPSAIEPKYWVVLPAAGSGSRMHGAIPKQYLPLAGRTVIEWSLQALLPLPDIAGVMVVLSATDAHFAQLPLALERRIHTTAGGQARAESVLNGVCALERHLQAQEHDWVLVHDAARPCLRREDVERLMQQLRQDEVGGLLACPVVDTLKMSCASQRVDHTVARAGLWRAFTPQMFRLGVLKRALLSTRAATDDAAAVEALGLKPKLVAGRGDNIKVTVSEDLQYAEYVLRSRQ
jgi:2-C-methyl-D-erythritol 4-phosphate cytidylyltransferase